ncbi:hypothetical protein Dda_0350 [Drechslerella dactyloides]|uniref:Cenp-o kinetochore centromere component n=1 Tax=Drechslerella dactyloides TaxID=74499 RepID=A0AAD6J7R1_DREDA|nr:hypothetical protein Dda_0350 [Drechslerella dactyloides]
MIFMASPSPPPPRAADGDLDALARQIRELTATRNARHAELLSLRSTTTLKDILAQTAAAASSETPLVDDADLNDILLARSAALTAEKQAWTQESLYRLAGLTAFTVRDPAPNGGELTGVRIEVMADGKFGTPFYIFLKPMPGTPTAAAAAEDEEAKSSKPGKARRGIIPPYVTIHRHTIPAYFQPALAALADKCLPPPPRPQDVEHLVRSLRRILFLHHLRATALSHVREKVQLSLPSDESQATGIYVSEFTVDPEARLVEIEWQGTDDSNDDNDSIDDNENGGKRLGWIALTEDGGIEGVVIKHNGRRIVPMEMQIKGPNWARGGADSMDWIEHLHDRLAWTD